MLESTEPNLKPFIPDLGDHSIPNLLRLAHDIEYRHACFRRADPDLALEDGCTEGTAKSLFNSAGKRLATAGGVRISQLGLTAADYKMAGALVDAKTISFASAGTLLEYAEKQNVGRDIKWYSDLATEMGLLITITVNELMSIMVTAIRENPRAVEDYRKGKKAAINVIFGWIMKNHKGLDPKVLREKLVAHLEVSVTSCKMVE